MRKLIIIIFEYFSEEWKGGDVKMRKFGGIIGTIVVTVVIATVLSGYVVSAQHNTVQGVMMGNARGLMGLCCSNDIDVDEILEDVVPSSKYALLIGSDGTATLITSRSFSKIYIQKDKKGWNSKADNLPAVCNIRNLNEICIYSRTSSSNNRFSDRLNDFEFLGQSSKNGYYVRKYKERSGD